MDLLFEFLTNNLAKDAQFQTIVFTFLDEAQVQRLKTGRINVTSLEGRLLRPAEPEARCKRGNRASAIPPLTSRDEEPVN